jgi:MADS-box transcription factor
MDDDDDDDGSGMSHHGSVEPQMMPPQFQNQPAFQHIRHQTPTNSPPIPNGVFHPHPQQQRQHTPQHDSRPSSRNANIPRRQSSNLVPQHPHPQPTNGYAFMPNPPMYNPQQPMPQHHGLPQHMQGPQMQGPQIQGPMQGPPMQGPQMQGPMHGPQVPQQAPQYPNYGPPQQHPQHQQVPQQVQQLYVEEQRRASMPPAFPQERPQSRPEASPPQPQQTQPPEPEDHPVQQMLEPVKRMSVKHSSIFTPIDESRSILSQHWASSTSNAESRSDTATSNNRSQSVDNGAVSRAIKQSDSPAPRSQTHNKRNTSMSSAPEGFHPPSRTNSASLGGAKRPALSLQIPLEDASDAGSATADSASSPRAATPPNAHHPPPTQRPQFQLPRPKHLFLSRPPPSLPLRLRPPLRRRLRPPQPLRPPSPRLPALPRIHNLQQSNRYPCLCAAESVHE